MITAYELPRIIQAQLPQLNTCRNSVRPLLRLFAIINDFADLTGKAIAQHHYLLAGKCFVLAGNFYRKGDRVVRSLIRNSFISGFRQEMPVMVAERTFVLSLMPDNLYHLYEDVLKEEPE